MTPHPKDPAPMSLPLHRDRQSARVPTNESWYPTAPNGTVEVSFGAYLDGSGYRVSVWGGDDHGLEQSFPNRADAIEMFRRVSRLSLVTHELLHGWGFRPA